MISPVSLLSSVVKCVRTWAPESGDLGSSPSLIFTSCVTFGKVAMSLTLVFSSI